MSETRPARRTCKALYRKCIFTPNPVDMKLEDVLRTALATRAPDGSATFRENWQSRSWTTNGADHGEPACLLINHIRDAPPGETKQSYLFGELVSYRPGSNSPILHEQDGRPELDIEVMAAPDRRQFLDAMTFWFICGNHVLVINGPNARRRHLEDYLRWLLRDQTGLLPQGRDITLVDQLLPPAGRAGELPIKSITIGGRTGTASESILVDKMEDVEKTAERASGDKRWVHRLLDVICGDPSRVDQMLDDLPADQEITVKLILGFRRRRRSIEKVPVQDVATMVRNLDDADLSFETAKGSMSGELMRLQHPVQVTMIERLLDREDVLRALVEAYGVFIGNGLIEED